ncbi:hypothetical protein LTR97_005086 [Elasticomyces elasticus]|uniref:F-box domain-containing protein n=1 Tax=Elasticomyces elasticus TaxID=574655 RepID=A0AAN7W5E2_9PEZI|nr:hypothetical protein LTR97_005086 [Elasticomyces elasticus]
MATATALAIVELFEHVLLNLEFHDLLVARAVSRNWESLIMKSLPLKRILFLAPTSDGLIGLDLPKSITPAFTRGPILTQQPSTTHSLFPRRPKDRCTSRNNITIPIPKRDLILKWLKDWPGGPRSVGPLAFYVFTWQLASLQAMAKSQFYMSMFLTQPACTAVTVKIMGAAIARYGAGRCGSSVVLRVHDGVRLGAIVWAVEMMMRSYYGASGDVDV